MKRAECGHMLARLGDDAAASDVRLGDLACPLGQGKIDQRPHRTGSRWRAAHDIGHSHQHRVELGDHLAALIDDHPPDRPGHFLRHRLRQSGQVHDVGGVPGLRRRPQTKTGRVLRRYAVVAVSGQTKRLGNLGPHGGEDLGIETRFDLFLTVGAGFHSILSGRAGPAQRAQPTNARSSASSFTCA